MKETDYEDFDRHRSSHSHVAKKKCKKRRSPPVDEVDVKHRFHRRDDDFEPRKKESRLKEYNDEPRRKERDYDNGESRRKDHHDHRRKESRREYEDGGEYSGKDKEHHRDRHTKKKCSKHKEHRSSDKRKNDDRNRVKQEPLSDSESDGDRTQSPRNYSNRGDKKPSNLDALMNVKEEKHEWGLGDDKEKKKPVVNTAKPDFGLSGKLAEETNIVNGVVIKYSEPEEARKPKIRWRLYPFKGDTSLPILHIHRQSAYLVGRDRKIADLPVDHPSCSKQHAVLQYRLVPFTRPNGTQGKRVRLYVLDLESANGTFINNNKIEPKKYVELLERDVIKFGFSSREYVLLHEHSKDDHLDDDVE